MRNPKGRCIVVGLADEHSGHQLGLLNPDAHWEMESPDGEIVDYHPQLTETQKYLWGVYTWARKEVFKLAGGYPLYVLQVGDLTQGKKHGHLVSPLVDHQAIMGRYTLLPWFEHKNLKALRIVIGTGAHNYGGGSSERICCSLLRAEHPKVSVKSLYHGLHTIGGVTFDTAHHGPYPGSRGYLKGNVARLYLRDAMQQDLELVAGGVPAMVYLRAHYHTWIKEQVEIEFQGKTYNSVLVEVPSFCGMDDYAHKVTRSRFTQTHGLAAFEIEKGKIVEIHKLTKTLDLRTKETL